MKLLYVEDNPLDADLTRRVLTKNLPDIGLNIASTVKEALAHLEMEDKVPFDILLLDVSLPDGDGPGNPMPRPGKRHICRRCAVDGFRG